MHRTRSARALPASAETVAAFVDAMARVRAPRDGAALRGEHRGCAPGHRVREDGEKRARATGAAAHAPAQRAGVRSRRKDSPGALRERMLDAAGEDLIDARDRALLAVAYDTLLRRGELVALQVSDIVEEVDGTATVLVRRGKAGPRRPGGDGVPRPRQPGARCTCGSSEAAYRKAGSSSSLSRGEIGEELEAGQVSRIFKRMAPQSPGCPRRWSSTSPGTAPGWVLRRTWSRGGSAWRPSSTRDGGRPLRWSTTTGSDCLRGEAGLPSSRVFSIANRPARGSMIGAPVRAAPAAWRATRTVPRESVFHRMLSSVNFGEARRAASEAWMAPAAHSVLSGRRNHRWNNGLNGVSALRSIVGREGKRLRNRRRNRRNQRIDAR